MYQGPYRQLLLGLQVLLLRVQVHFMAHLLVDQPHYDYKLVEMHLVPLYLLPLQYLVVNSRVELPH
jgi:hypothetical protein